jgi:hypothetical protein
MQPASNAVVLPLPKPKPSNEDDDGRFYAKGGKVWRASKATRVGTTTNYTLGFPVCELSEYASNDAAEAIATGLNAALDAGWVK